MIVNDVHNNAYPLRMESLNHLFVFVYAFCAVRRVGGIASLGHVIVLRVVTPVELRVGARFAFVYRRIVERRQQMHVSDTELFYIIDAHGNTVLVFKPRFRKSEIFTLIL